MSWHFHFLAQSKAAAVAGIETEAFSPYGISPGVAGTIGALVQAMPEVPRDHLMQVSSNGHIDSTNGNCVLDIRFVRIVPEPAPDKAANTVSDPEAAVA